MKRASLFYLHQRTGAKFAERHGWEMPASFAPPRSEESQVRERVGLADLSYRAKFDTKVLALDIEAGWTVEDAQAAGWPNDHPDRVEARWPAIQGTLGVNEDALPGEGRL